MGLTTLIYTYLIGGVTFIPLVVVFFIYLHPIISLDDEHHEQETMWDADPHLKAGEIEERNESGLDTYKTGWITVTQEYLESIDNISSNTQAVSESSQNKSAYSSLYKLVKNSDTVITNNNDANDDDGASSTADSKADEKPAPTLSAAASTATATPNGANGSASGSTSSTSSTAAAKSSSQKKHRYFAVLKHGNLFLYKNDKLKDVKHVIVLSNHLVSIWPKGLTDAQLFTKYTAIVIMKKNWCRNRRLSDNYDTTSIHDEFDYTTQEKIAITDVLKPTNNLQPPPGSFFIYCDTNSEKEDWYFALIRATKLIVEPSSTATTTSDNEKHVFDDDHLQTDQKFNPNIHAKTLHFETANMINLIQTLYSSEGQLHTKWLNAIIGRMFLSLQKTELLTNFLKKRIDKKLNKIKTPGFLDKFQITKLEPGNSAPFLTFPELKEINPNGDLVVSTNFHYFGSMSMQIATKVNINLGGRFKPREVDVVLSITLVKLQGSMLIKFKPPPSNRIWYTFESEPIINLKIEPIISSRQLTYNIITNTIEKKFKEAIKDSLVLPHWDDFAYYDTTGEVYRGGMWDKSSRPTDATSTNTNTAATSTNNPTNAATTSPSRESNGTTGGASTIDDHASLNPSSINDADGASIYSAGSKADLSPAKSPSNPRLKLTNTFNDLSRRLRKPRSSSNLNELDSSVEGSKLPSDTGSVKTSSTSIPQLAVDDASSMLSDKSSITTNTSETNTNSKKPMNTLKKIGKWYFKDGRTAASSPTSESANYTPPEMISNRRHSPRKSSTSGITPQVTSSNDDHTINSTTSSANGNKSENSNGPTGMISSPSYDFGSKFSASGMLVSGNFDSNKNLRQLNSNLDDVDALNSSSLNVGDDVDNAESSEIEFEDDEENVGTNESIINDDRLSRSSNSTSNKHVDLNKDLLNLKTLPADIDSDVTRNSSPEPDDRENSEACGLNIKHADLEIDPSLNPRNSGRSSTTTSSPLRRKPPPPGTSPVLP